VLSTTLRLTAIICSVLIGLGWILFAIGETKSASAHTALIVSGDDAATRVDLDPDQERAREAIHSEPREVIDDANDILLSPFSSVTASSDNKWVRRTVPALIGLLAFGLGLGYLARFATGRAR
jgi:hypothetical protein